MPEGIEIEYYRETAELVLGRTVAQVQANDAWYLKGGLTGDVAKRLLVGQRVEAARRVGKLLLLDLSDSTLGLRFGMTGRLLVDGESAIERLEYSSGKNDPAWDRFALTFDDGGVMSMRDPRRLGGVALDPDERTLGVDLFSVTPGSLRKALANATPALKARLLDQKRIAGLGNLLTDEILWRAGLDPRRQAGSLSDAEIRRLHRHLRATVEELKELGGSHMGTLQDHRTRGGQCPKDGEPLERYTIGGRTTYSCPVHQSGQTR